MPEIMRNLAIERLLQRLGMLIWVGDFSLAFDNKMCNNN